MGMLLEKMQIYGYSADQEAVVLSALLTGEPCLLIGDIGSAKTTIIKKLGKSLAVMAGIRTAVYNASVDSFEDMIGFVDLSQLRDGKADYITTPATIWDKELVGVDEVNRPKASVSSKWLDYLQDRTMMGVRTSGMFLFGAMNPLSVQGTNPMGEATLGRFTSFVWVPELINMSKAERRAVLRCTTDSTLPGMKQWHDGVVPIGDPVDYKRIALVMQKILEQAADHYSYLKGKSAPIESFLDDFVTSVWAETKGSKETENRIRIDGRRGGMLFRHIMALRAVELARANVLGYTPKTLGDSVRVAIRSGLPIGVNSETGVDKDTTKKIDQVVERLIPFLDDNLDHRTLELHTELLTGRDPFRKLEILLTEPIHEVVKTQAWQKFAHMRHFNGFVIGYVCMQIEAAHPGTVPESAIDDLVKLMDSGPAIPEEYILTPDMEPFHDEIQSLLEQSTLWSQLIAGHVISEMLVNIPTQAEDKQIRTALATATKDIRDLSMRAQGVNKLIEEIVEETGDGKPAASRSRKKNGGREREGVAPRASTGGKII